LIVLNDHFRRALEDCDIALARKIWAHAMPHLPQPKDDAQALVMLHHARTQASSIAFKLRAYSHAWLCERGYPSGLPDELRPRAERIYPRIASVVGIATRTRSDLALAVRTAMSGAVMEAVEDRRIDDAPFVRSRMSEARAKVLRGA
jgi:hypothetical protein